MWDPQSQNPRCERTSGNKAAGIEAETPQPVSIYFVTGFFPATASIGAKTLRGAAGRLWSFQFMYLAAYSSGTSRAFLFSGMSTFLL